VLANSQLDYVQANSQLDHVQTGVHLESASYAWWSDARRWWAAAAVFLSVGLELLWLWRGRVAELPEPEANEPSVPVRQINY
jgi:hypothetical protein